MARFSPAMAHQLSCLRRASVWPMSMASSENRPKTYSHELRRRTPLSAAE